MVKHMTKHKNKWSDKAKLSVIVLAKGSIHMVIYKRMFLVILIYS